MKLLSKLQEKIFLHNL